MEHAVNPDIGCSALPSWTVAVMPAPQWFFRFMYDRESSALERRHDQPDRRELDEATVDALAGLVNDPSAPLSFGDASLGGVLAILVVQHLPDPADFIAEIRRCLRPVDTR